MRTRHEFTKYVHIGDNAFGGESEERESKRYCYLWAVPVKYIPEIAS